MIKVAGISLCCLIFSLLLKNKNRVFAVIVSLFGACFIFYSVLNDVRVMLQRFTDLTEHIGSVSVYLKIMLKVLGITLLAQFVSDLCRDNGESALASVTEMAAKTAVIIIVLPLFETVITLIGGLIK